MLLDILGVMYTQRYYKEHDTANTDHGFSQIWKQDIGVLSGMPRDMTAKVILHEVIEQWNEQLELELKHPQITALETAMHHFLRMNPHFIEKYYLEKYYLEDDEIEEEEEVDV